MINEVKEPVEGWREVPEENYPIVLVGNWIICHTRLGERPSGGEFTVGQYRLNWHGEPIGIAWFRPLKKAPSRLMATRHNGNGTR